MPLENIPWDIIIGGIALILSIIGIYYTHKSLRSPILLEARKKHSAELIDFLREWYDRLPLYESATDPKITSTPSTSITHLNESWPNFLRVETNWKYRDFIQNHLPAGYKALPQKWNEYKRTINEYGEMRHQLYEKIKKDVLSSEMNLKYDPDWKGDHIISAHFLTLLYTQYVAWVRDSRLSADKARGYKQERNELWFGGWGLVKGTEEELFHAKDVFEKMMFDESYLIKYRTDILKIIEMEKWLKCVYEEMKEMIEKLMGYPLLPGTKCEILKNI